MTDKRVFIEISDTDQLEEFLQMLGDKKNRVIVYTKDFVTIKEVDMDLATVTDVTGNEIPINDEHQTLVPSFERDIEYKGEKKEE